MSNIVPLSSTAVAPVDARKPNKSESRLAAIEAKCLLAFDHKEKVVAYWRGWTSTSRELFSTGSWFANIPPGSKAAVDEATRRIAVLEPQLADLEAAREATETALDQPPHKETIRAIVATMIDAFPNARPHSAEGYFAALVYDIHAAGYPAPVVAHACQQLRRNCTFPPTIAELIAACENARIDLDMVAACARRGIAILEDARAALAVGVTAPEPRGDGMVVPFTPWRMNDRQTANTSDRLAA